MVTVSLQKCWKLDSFTRCTVGFGWTIKAFTFALKRVNNYCTPVLISSPLISPYSEANCITMGMLLLLQSECPLQVRGSCGSEGCTLEWCICTQPVGESLKSDGPTPLECPSQDAPLIVYLQIYSTDTNWRLINTNWCGVLDNKSVHFHNESLHSRDTWTKSAQIEIQVFIALFKMYSIQIDNSVNSSKLFRARIHHRCMYYKKALKFTLVLV